MSDKPSNSNQFSARALAKALQKHPVPYLGIPDLIVRWSCSRSTVERHRVELDLKSYGRANEHPKYSLFDILRAERMERPEIAWATGSDLDREILLSRLLTNEDLAKLDAKLGGRHLETFRRRARDARRLSEEWDATGIDLESASQDRVSFKIGHQWRYRPKADDLPYLNAELNSFGGKR